MCSYLFGGFRSHRLLSECQVAFKLSGNINRLAYTRYCLSRFIVSLYSAGMEPRMMGQIRPPKAPRFSSGGGYGGGGYGGSGYRMYSP